MHYPRGQGATEYLVVLGAVLLVSMVVVQAVSSSTSSGVDLKQAQSDSYWKSATPFSISSYTMEGGMLAAVLKNNLAEPLKLTSVQVVDSAGTSALWSGSMIIAAGGESTVFMRYGLNNSCKNSAGGNPFEITQITFNYDKTSVSGLKQIGDKSLAGKCAAQQGIVFRSPTPADNAAASANSNVSINVTIDGSTAIKLKDFGLVWNGTNTSFYDDSLVLAMNFDDVYELGERGGKVVDVSNHGNNGTIYGNTAGLWHFDEADGRAAVDESRFGNNGTVYGNTKLLLHLDENTGNIIFDESAYRNNGTIYGATWVTGKSGSGLSFDGVNDYVDLNRSLAQLGSKSTISIEAWIKPTGPADTGTGDYAVYRIDSAVGETGGQGPVISRGIIGGLDRIWAGNYHGVAPAEWVGVIYNVDEWVHIVLVHANGVLYIYKNGVLGGSVASASSNLDHLLYQIGRSENGQSTFFNGTVDEVAFYNRSLTAAEILDHYNAGKAKFIEWTTGKSGTGLQFDGVNDFVLIGNSASLNLTDRMTVEMWVKPNRLSNDPMVLSKTISTSYYLQLLSTGSIQFGIDYAGGAGRWDSSSAGAVSVGSWYHVVGTYDKNGGSNNLKIYSNGVLVGQDTFTGSAAGNSDPLYLSLPSGAYSFNGSIDEVGIYNRSLSAAEVLSHYNAGRAKHADWDTNGKYGSSTKFDGVNDYVNTSNSASLNITGTVTACAWIKTAGTNNYSGIIDKFGSTVGYELVFDVFGKLRFNLGGNPYGNAIGTTDLRSNTWQFVCGTYNGSQIRAYVNGNSEKSTEYTTGLTLDAKTLQIGVDSDAPNRYFNGSIDEVRIWNRALSSAEVRQQYYSSLNKFASDRWVFNSTQTFLPAGTHTYYLYANATDGSSDFTEERTLRVS